MKVHTLRRSLEALVLLAGLVSTFAFAAIPQVPTPGGPIPICPPSNPNCDPTVVVAIQQAPTPGGPIPICPPKNPDCDPTLR